MTDEMIQKICSAYRKRFTAEQVNDMSKRTRKRIVTGETFKFGPSTDKKTVKFTKRCNTISLVLVENNTPPVSIASWTTTFRGIDEHEIAKDMLDLIALWDITMKQYYIDLSRKYGMEP